MRLYYCTTSTPVGDFHFFIKQPTATAVVCATGFDDLNLLYKRLPKDLSILPLEEISEHPYKKAIQSYFAGDKRALDTIPREQHGSPFRQKVWEAMSRIPFGKTYSYKELATQAGNSEAVRAAGTACGKNNLPLLVPCHRVVKSDGSVGNFLYGPAMKESLLAHEASFAS